MGGFLDPFFENNPGETKKLRLQEQKAEENCMGWALDGFHAKVIIQSAFCTSAEWAVVQLTGPLKFCS
jgi:hypothetical protein